MDCSRPKRVAKRVNVAYYVVFSTLVYCDSNLGPPFATGMGGPPSSRRHTHTPGCPPIRLSFSPQNWFGSGRLVRTTPATAAKAARPPPARRAVCVFSSLLFVESSIFGSIAQTFDFPSWSTETPRSTGFPPSSANRAVLEIGPDDDAAAVVGTGAGTKTAFHDRV
jgi:hypothetical protein